MTVSLELLEKFRLVSEDVRHPFGFELMTEMRLIDIIKGQDEPKNSEVLSESFDRIVTAEGFNYRQEYGYDYHGIVWEHEAIDDFLESFNKVYGENAVPFTRKYSIGVEEVFVTGVIPRVSGMFNQHWITLWKWPQEHHQSYTKDVYEHLSESLLWRIPLEYMDNQEALFYALQCIDTESGTYTIESKKVASYKTFPMIHDENRAVISNFIEWVQKRGLEKYFDYKPIQTIEELL